MSLAGLIYANALHYLDHLAPLCALLEVPLVVTDDEIAALAILYYPGLKLLHWDPSIAPDRLVEQFDTILCCTPRALFDEIFFFPQELRRKRVETLWCPHGNSDKGAAVFYMESLQEEKGAVLYGKQMIEFLRQKSVLRPLERMVRAGNYRRLFFEKHRRFYAQSAKKALGLPEGFRRLLYAPTWQDCEGSCSFFDAIEPLAEKLPQDTQLVIKLHPNLRLQYEHDIADCIERYEGYPRIRFLAEFPPIYALLSQVDGYIGDMSSIGYDFLSFDKPLFFLNQQERCPQKDRGLYLSCTGTLVEKKDYSRIHDIISSYFVSPDPCHGRLRKALYKEAFGQRVSQRQLKDAINEVILT